jgi:20S proteasome alpha/beta subunit
MQAAIRSQLSLEPIPDEKKLSPMTLVVALFNENEIVLAADTMIYDYASHKSLKPIHKIMQVGNHLFASSGTGAGYDIARHLDALGFSPNADIDVASQEYFHETNVKYRDRKYGAEQTSSVLFAGFGKKGPQVFYWPLPSHTALTANPQGYVSIGVKENASLSFPRLYHYDSMTTEQRVRLAHFTITKAGESDPRVGNPREGYPVDIAVLNRDGVRMYTEADLKPFVASSQRIHDAILRIFESIS